MENKDWWKNSNAMGCGLIIAAVIAPLFGYSTLWIVIGLLLFFGTIQYLDKHK